MTARLERLPWDSAFFEREIARLHAESLTDLRQAEVDAWCRDHSVDCLYWLAPCGVPGLDEAAHRLGFFFAGSRAQLETHAVRSHRPAEPDPRVRVARKEDVPRLCATARIVHGDSRFSLDDRLRDRAPSLFERWIQRDFERPLGVVLVSDLGHGACGYCACHPKDDEPDVGTISLVGVDPASGGRGLGTALIHRAMDWFSLLPCRRVEVVTQGSNVPAQRLYQSAGFRTMSVGTWYHRWRGG